MILKSKIFLHPEISCLLVASMYGNPADMVQLEGLCKEHGIKLIDDAAQSFGAKIQDRFIGTFGDAGFMAFHRENLHPLIWVPFSGLQTNNILSVGPDTLYCII